jgi:mono/diheme cytochrome c family protein
LRTRSVGLHARARIACRRALILWHNETKGVCMNYSRPFVHADACRPRRICRIILPAIGAFLLLAASAPRTQNAAAQSEKSETVPAGNTETGKKIFTKDGCYECHGREGQGAAQGAGPRIGPLQLSFEAFTKYVHQPTGQMPPYTSKVISDQDLADIYAYLQSRPKATPSKDIPLLNQ